VSAGGANAGGLSGSGGGQLAGSGGQSVGSGGQGAGHGGGQAAGAGGVGTGGSAWSGGAVGGGGAGLAGGSSGRGGAAAGGGGPAGGVIGAGGTTTIGGAGGTSSGGGSSGRSDAGDASVTDGARPDGAVGPDGRADGGGGNGGVTGGASGSGGVGGTGGIDTSKKIKVWLAGDSTMMNCTGACPCGWGSQFQSLLNSNATVVNNAVGGRSIQTWLYDPNVTSDMGSNGECVVSPKTYSTRWQDMLDTTSGMKSGDYLFIEFGINDGDSSCSRHVGTALFQDYLGVMAKAAKNLGAQPVFLTSTSAIACSGSSASANRGFGSQTKAAGTANSVPVIDLTTLSAQFYTSQGLCPNNSDYTSTTSAVGQFFCEDHTHFEAAGAVKIAGVVAKAIKDQGIGLAAYLK
jgi:lysophospholipase L1-like esterase